MMGVVSKIIENTIANIEAITPTVKPGKRFEALTDVDIETLPRVPGSHRKFAVKYGEDYTIDTSFPWRAETDMEINRTIDFLIVHRIAGRDIVQANKDISEDVDQIVVALLQVDGYGTAQDTDGTMILRDINEGPLITMDLEQGSALTTMQFVVKYQRKI